MDLLEGTERWEASPHQANNSAEVLNEVTMEEVSRPFRAGPSGLKPWAGFLAPMRKRQVSVV